MKTKPKLGQNFLIEPRARRLLVDALGPLVHRTVLEIGPGKAAVTHLLAGRAARLIAVELDPVLASALRTEFAAAPAVEILEADILSLDLSLLAHGQPRSLAVLGNLPYYITSPILRHLFAHQQVLSRAVLMVQREVAERITAEPGGSDYGLLTVLCQMHARTELLFTLPPEAFAPPPEVHSAAVRMEFAPRWEELAVSPEPFTRFLGVCFAQKRKTLANNLRAAGFAAETVTAALAGKPPHTRAEELAPAQLAAIFRKLDPAPLR